jgi:demethylmenaquinone methyltransferase / 2-methoxy-6-polyprenyl-1,4-benzoquinol methylase
MTDNRNGAAIQTMFDRISPRYDLLNRILSFGVDLRWRKRAVTLLGDLKGKTALDLCCGSGDFVAIIQKRFGTDVSIIGADFARQMLGIAQGRITPDAGSPLLFCQADALSLPLADNSIDAVTIGFGIRNIADKESALREIIRVLRLGGRLAIVEPAMPDNRLMRFIFTFYFKNIMPLVGGIISGDHAAYRYLHDSVSTFPRPNRFVAMMQAAGFVDAKAVPQSFGSAMIYIGEK